MLVGIIIILFILMDFPINVHILDMELSILYYRGSQVEVSKS